MFHVPEKYRLTKGPAPSDASYGNNGDFAVPYKRANRRFTLFVRASDQEGWEHVSVSIRKRPMVVPDWFMMDWIKKLFWDSDDVVVQYHPAERDHVNRHPGVLHLWRPIGIELPKPFTVMV